MSLYILKRLARARAFNMGHELAKFAIIDGAWTAKCKNCTATVRVYENDLIKGDMYGTAIEFWCSDYYDFRVRL